LEDTLVMMLLLIVLLAMRMIPFGGKMGCGVPH
jgi:hypothetical protein